METLPGASSIAIASDKLRSKIEKLFGIDLNLSSCLIYGPNLPMLTSIGKLFFGFIPKFKGSESRKVDFSNKKSLSSNVNGSVSIGQETRFGFFFSFY